MTLRLNRRLFFFCLAALILPSKVFAAAPFSRVEAQDRSIKKKIERKILNLDLRARLILADETLDDGLGFSAKYRFAVEPSFSNALNTRVDGWDLGLTLNPESWFSDEPNSSIGLNGLTAIRFVRQYTSVGRAIAAPPHTLASIPWTARKAIDRLEPGTLFTMPLEMNILIDTKWPLLTYTHASVFPYAFFLIKAVCNIQVLRLPDNHVRLRINLSRSRTLGASAVVFDSPASGVRVFNLDILDDDIRAALAAKVELGKFSRTKGGLTLLDYELDLDSPAAKSAFNKIMRPLYKLKGNPLLRLTRQPPSTVQVSYAKPVADLAEEDIGRPNPRAKLVSSISEVSNDRRFQSLYIQLPSLINVSLDSTRESRDIKIVDGQGRREDLHQEIVSRDNRFSFFFGRLKKSTLTQAWYQTPNRTERRNAPVNSGFGGYFETRDRKLTWTEQRKLRSMFDFYFPRKYRIEAYKHWKKALTDGPQSNARVVAHVAFDSQVLERLPQFSQRMIESKLDEAIAAYKKYFPKQARRYFDSGRGGDGFGTEFGSSRENSDRRRILKALKTASDQMVPLEKRLNGLTKLLKNKLFRMVGFRFAFSLLDRRTIDKHTSFRLLWTSDNVPSIHIDRRGDLLKMAEHLRNQLRLIDAPEDLAVYMEDSKIPPVE